MIKETASVLAIDLFHWMYRNWVKLILVLGLASWLAVLSFPGNKVKIVYCNAGQGDETLIQRGFTQILIDGSRKGRALDCLRKHIPFFDRQIELMVVSHPQTDHFGGLADVIKRYKVMSFVYNGVKGDSREWEEFSRAVLAEEAEIETVAAGDEIRAGGMKLKVLWPKKSVISSQLSVVGSQSISYQSVGQQPANRKPADQNLKTDNRKPITDSVLGVAASGEINSGAVVADFSYGDFNALFTGDIGEEEEREIIRITGQQANRLTGYQDAKIKKPDNLPTFQPVNLSSIDVLKVAHHGSKYSSSLEFLKAVRPALAVIEVGKNSYGHPAGETVGRLEEVGAQVLRTDQDGDVVVETDGRGWKVTSEKFQFTNTKLQ